jgi:hypothetical protein
MAEKKERELTREHHKFQAISHNLVGLKMLYRPLCAASSTDRCNTLGELLSWRLIEQGLSRPLIELSCDGAELGLTV